MVLYMNVFIRLFKSITQATVHHDLQSDMQKFVCLTGKVPSPILPH